MKIKRDSRKITPEVYKQVKDFIELGMKRGVVCGLFEPCIGHQTFTFIKQSNSIEEFRQLQQVANIRNKKTNEVVGEISAESDNQEKIITNNIPQPIYTNTLDNSEMVELLKTQNKILIELNNAVIDLNGMVFRLIGKVEPTMTDKVKSLFRV